MATVQEHYSALLAEIYPWMLGGFDEALPRNRELVRRLGLVPRGSGVAVDAGAGCGFQSIPLAESGYEVYAIDTDPGLLGELERRSQGLGIAPIRGDLRDLREHVPTRAELVVCMTDTILLLDSKDEVSRFFRDAHEVLEPEGRLVATFRDLSRPLVGLDRFVPVRADRRAVLTCFLEYEPDTVKIHDLAYLARGDGWEFRKSEYRKLRLSCDWVIEALSSAGFGRIDHEVERGVCTVVATRP